MFAEKKENIIFAELFPDSKTSNCKPCADNCIFPLFLINISKSDSKLSKMTTGIRYLNIDFTLKKLPEVD